jgi:hypothetical protein
VAFLRYAITSVPDVNILRLTPIPVFDLLV